MKQCEFCGSREEVSLIPVDIPSNLKPVCVACYEAFQDACRDTESEEEHDESNR